MSNYLKIAVFMIVCAAASCKKDDPIPTGYTAPVGSYNLAMERILKPSCGLSNCHSKEGDFGHHGLVNDCTYQHLLTDPIENNKAFDDGLRLLVPGKPDSSFLYIKMKWDNNPVGYGQKMPTGGLTLTAKQIAFVRQWIVAGAPESGHVADSTLLK
jgi:hypothetical protein